MRRSPFSTVLFLMVTALLVGGCVLRSGPDSFRRSPSDDSVRIYVTNLNFMDATLWAVTNGGRDKLGVVTGKRNDLFTLPWRGYTDLRIEFNLLSGPRCMTESLPVSPGDDIELIINLDLSNSPLCRWPPNR